MADPVGNARLLDFMRRQSEELVDAPQYATIQGLDVGIHARLRHKLDDRSTDALRRRLARTQANIAAISALDPATMSGSFALHREIMLYAQHARVIGPERFGITSPQLPFVITHRDGAYFTVPDFLSTTHAIRNAEDAEAYLDRVQAFAAAFDQDSQRQADEAARGFLAPGFILERAIAQMAALRTPDAAGNILTRSIIGRTGHAIPRTWGPRCAAIIGDEVYPALDRQIALMRRLCDGARSSAGVWDLPEGEALYRAALKDATTTEASAADLHRLGLETSATIASRLDGLLAAQGVTGGTIGERLAILSRRPDLLYADTAAGREELLRDAASFAGRIRNPLASVFRHPPDAPLRIEPAAVEIEAGASEANYFPGSWDGVVPARLRLNLGALAGSPRYALPALIYHEGLPGHHLQYSSSGAAGSIRFTAYSEGWAVYAEQLADDLGGYASPLERIGYLQSRLYRAARLVADTGINAKQWSRETAAARFGATTGYPPAVVQREIDRYCVQPGQACSYMVGYLA